MEEHQSIADEPRVPCDGAWSESHAQAVSTLDADYDDNQYDTLYEDPRGDDILSQSPFFNSWMQYPNLTSQLYLDVASNRVIQVGFHVVSSLVRRWTCWQLNWKTETLRSFLEVLVWTSVTAVAYSVHHDVLWAAQIGFSVGLAMSICDEVFVAGAKSAFQWIQQDPHSALVLQRWGFDVGTPAPLSVDKGMSVKPASSDDVLLIKNVIFGAMALESLRHVYLGSTHDIQQFAGLATAMGVAYVLVGELFCLWLPTRRLGLTVQSRWTHIPENWNAHFLRSLVEVTCWVASLVYVYCTTASVVHAVGWSSVLGIGLCIAGGLDPLTHSSASSADDDVVSTYWSRWAGGSAWMDCASALLSLDQKVD
ncbi:hypothetical protein DYB25_008431 [Aphanomyces astaci]|uniref:Uncharacterized protein n=1 Tax=Aphanomyces astaci TaxID=112090 RepID=A0A397BUK4_APHAT|nr:hypothetical protein DYB25_008431 [Aphanomyces astaci]RHZ05175.1 hypothetical protein DYB26_007154 [Aphanomyces astaci]RQM19939.1 hypothetical protein B5M09_002329 [Aphanomyces astaci]